MMAEEVKRGVGKRGPDKQPRKAYKRRLRTMRNISVRLPEEVVRFYRGSSEAMRLVLVKHMLEKQKAEETNNLTLLGSGE